MGASMPISAGVNAGSSQPAAGRSAGAAGMTTGYYYPWAGETLQGANAGLYTVDENSLDGLRLAKTTGQENLICYIDGKSLGTTYLDSSTPSSTGFYNDTAALSTAVADPYSGAENVLLLERASLDMFQVELPNISTDKFTVDLQFYAAVNNAAQYLAYGSDYITTSSEQGFYLLMGADGKMDANVQDAGFKSIASTGLSNISTYSVTTWTHLRLSYSGANTRFSLYKDGTRVGQSTGAVADVGNICRMIFGGQYGPSGNVNTFDGYLADIRIYDAELASGGASFTAPTAYLAGVYDVTDGAVWGGTTIDLGSEKTVDVSTTSFDWAAGGSGTANTTVQWVAKSANSFAIGDVVGGNWFEDGGSPHADVTGRYVKPYFKQNTGAFVDPERLDGLGFDLV